MNALNVAYWAAAVLAVWAAFRYFHHNLPGGHR